MTGGVARYIDHLQGEPGDLQSGGRNRQNLSGRRVTPFRVTPCPSPALGQRVGLDRTCEDVVFPCGVDAAPGPGVSVNPGPAKGPDLAAGWAPPAAGERGPPGRSDPFDQPGRYPSARAGVSG